MGCAEGNEDLVKLLLSYGAHINSIDEHGDTSLHWAVRESRENVLRLLVEVGADLSILKFVIMWLHCNILLTMMMKLLRCLLIA